MRWDDQCLWTHILTPQLGWDQLAARSDSQIGFQELLGVVPVIGTWPPLEAGSLWVGFEIMTVSHMPWPRRGHNPECNMVIGKICMHLADCDTDLHAAWVESEASIAGGPTRDNFQHLEHLQARSSMDS